MVIQENQRRKAAAHRAIMPRVNCPANFAVDIPPSLCIKRVAARSRPMMTQVILMPSEITAIP